MDGLSGEIRLGDKLFSVVNYDAITVINESYIHKLMRETGLDLPLPFRENETDVEYQLRMQARVIDTLRLHELLGGFLLPLGKTESDWSPDLAAQTAQHVAGLTSREDREEVFRLAFLLNVYFFRNGLDSLGIFPNSSRNETKPSPPNGTEKKSPNAVH